MDDTATTAIVTLLVAGALLIVWWGCEWAHTIREGARLDAQARQRRLQRIGKDAKALCAESAADPIRVPVRVHREPLPKAMMQQAQQAPISSNRGLLDTLGITPAFTPPGQPEQQEVWERLQRRWAAIPDELH